jgi:PleD family two-component response regulator
MNLATLTTSGLEALMRRADQALYEAKRAGRDRVMALRQRDPDTPREAAE